LFRDFTKRNARKLNLKGTVENLSDGTVRVVAEGDENRLHELLEAMKKGPPLAKVEDVKVDWQEPTNKFSDFKIIYHGFLDRL